MYADWFLIIRKAESTCSPIFCPSDPNHIWRLFEMWFQSDFHWCVSVWIQIGARLRDLKLDFNVPFSVTTNNGNVKSRVMEVLGFKKSAIELWPVTWQSNCLAGEMMFLQYPLLKAILPAWLCRYWCLRRHHSNPWLLIHTIIYK